MLNQNKAEYATQCKETLFLEAVKDLDVVCTTESPRVLNTHLPYRLIPKDFIQKGGKIVHIIRNPKDMLVSRYFFLKDRKKELADLPWTKFFDMNTNGDGMF